MVRSRMVSLVLVAMAVGTLLSASCSTTPTAPATSAESTASTKPYGSLMVAADFGAFNSLDPQADSGMAMDGSASGIFDSLVFIDSDIQLKPGIAERWEISRDGLSLTFYIRRGVKFHDGSALAGADVKFSIERMIAPASIESKAATWRGAVAGVELKDDYTVVLHMKEPTFELLTGVHGGMGAVVPKKYIEEKGLDYFRKNPVGSGPWKFVKFAAGDRLELDAVESHWREVPKFKNITLLHVPDEATKIAMLKTGELDLAMVSRDSVPALKAAGQHIFSFNPGTQAFVYVFYDMEHPEQYALGDVRVRKALQLATNNKEIADKLLGGYGEPYAVYAVPKSAYFFDPNVLKPDPYDPEAAKRLLPEGGYPTGFKTRMYDRAGGGVVNAMGAALVGYWQRIGVTAETVPVQQATIYSMYVPKHKPEIWNSVYPVMGSPTIAFEKMSTSYHSTKGSGKTTNSPRLDELIAKVPQTADPAERKRLALEAALLAKNEYGILTLVEAHSILSFGSKIGQILASPAIAIRGTAFESITHAK